MFAHGIRELGHDVDVVAQGKAWQMAQKLGKPKILPHGSPNIQLFNGQVEVSNDWWPGKWNVNKLINQAEIVEGVRFVRLEHVLKWKMEFARPKDLKDIKMIENYLNSQDKI